MALSSPTSVPTQPRQLQKPVPASAQECAIGHFENSHIFPTLLARQPPPRCGPIAAGLMEVIILLFGTKMVAKEPWCFLVG